MLRITKQTDYGIVLMTFLAVGRARKVHNARDLAQDTNLPPPTVSKILKALARADLLISQRGVKGGYSLARDPSEISVEEIIAALEGPIAITDCCEEAVRGCDIERSCPVRVNWQRINDAVLVALRGIPLSEMAASFTFSSPVPSETR
ncbi:MAG: SUF system Fe-S cluster assembly regulator [Planctomycetota bacterium]